MNIAIVGATGNVGSKILKVDPKDGKSEVFSSGFDGATGNDFDSKGFLYQASFSTGTLYRIDLPPVL